MQLRESKDKRTALVVGVSGKQNIERYLGIVIPQLPDKGVKGWCIKWIKGKVIPVFTGAMKKDEA